MLAADEERRVALRVRPLEIRAFFYQELDNINITSVSGNKNRSSSIMYGPIHIRADRAEKPHDLEVPVLDRRRERRAPMNFGVDVERRLVRLVYDSFYFF